jgi:hypothetical protein
MNQVPETGIRGSLGEPGVNYFTSESVRRNTLVFAILLVLLQIGISLVYGFFFFAPPNLINVGSVVTTIGLAILIVAGNSPYTQALASSLATPRD